MRIKALSLSILVVYALGAALALAYLLNASRQITNITQLWDQHKESQAKNDHLMQLHMAEGYGGLIHHFKNYIIRRDDTYYHKAMESYHSMQRTFSSFRKLPLSEQEKEELRIMEETADLYLDKLNIAYNLVDEKMSTAAIDQRVMVDDTKAINALRTMNERLNNQYHGNSHAFGAYMTENRQALLVALPVVLLVMVGFSSFCVWFMYYRITGPLAGLTETIKQTHNLDKAHPMPHQNRRDEIGVIANAIEEFKAELKKNEKMKSRFMATMSHEIRTPIHGVLGMAELILSSQPSDKIRTHAQTILNSGEALLTIVNDILDFSKMEAGKVRLTPVPVHLGELMDDMAALYSAKARDKQIELAVHCDLNAPPCVLADTTRLRQILGNVISNAVTFTDKGHVVAMVEALDMAADSPTAPIRYRFTIKDTGIGIAADKLPHIFEHFNQAHRESDGKYGGTGLGLSIAKNLVEYMGGRVDVESTPSKGTVFTIELPLIPDANAKLPKHHYPLLENTRMLVVDDLPFFRHLVVEQITHANARCDTAPSASTALQMLRAAEKLDDPYDIVLIDYLMPDMNGTMLADAIASHSELNHTCLVLMTSCGLPASHYDFEGHGFSGFIAKPIEHRGMLHHLETIWSAHKKGETLAIGDIHTQPLPSSEDITAPGAHVLVAEDNVVNQVFITEILKEMQCTYVLVNNGKEALDAARKTPFDLVLMDCLMPILDGYEATRTLCQWKSHGIINPEMPIVALTANAAGDGQEQCFKAGMTGYISKPIRKKPLKECLYQWLTQQGDHSPSSTTSVQAIHPSRSGKSNASPLLDDERVAEARSILKEQYVTLIPSYLESCWQRMSELKLALIDHQWEDAIRAAHTLKSSSMQMGVAAFSNHAMEMEVLTRTAQTENTLDPACDKELQSKLADMQQALTQTQPLLDALAA